MLKALFVFVAVALIAPVAFVFIPLTLMMA